MSDRPVLVPGPGHPIAIEPVSARVVVSVGGTEIGESRNALRLTEAQYPPVLYVPRKDVRMDLLVPNPRSTYCPYKGQAGYFDLAPLGAAGVARVWTYERPHPAVVAIAGHLAFYPDAARVIEGPESGS